VSIFLAVLVMEHARQKCKTILWIFNTGKGIFVMMCHCGMSVWKPVKEICPVSWFEKQCYGKN